MNKDGILYFGYDTEIHGVVFTVRVNGKREVFSTLIDDDDDIAKVDEWLKKILSIFIENAKVVDAAIEVIHEQFANCYSVNILGILLKEDDIRTRFHFSMDLNEVNKVGINYLKSEGVL